VAVLLNDELAAKGNHEQDAQPATEQSQGEDAPEGELLAEAEKDERGDGEHDAGGERFAGRARGLDDVVFKDGGAAKGTEDTDREDRGGGGGREGGGGGG